MLPNDYQYEAEITNKYFIKYDENTALLLLTVGLNGEAGEVAEKIKKYFRDDIDFNIMQEVVAKELGDVLWYLSCIANHFEITLEEVMKINLAKLKSRSERNVIHGSGDER